MTVVTSAQCARTFSKLGYSRRTNDPRIERFWELVATMKGRPASVSPFIAAQRLLIDGLDAQLGERSST